MQKNRWVHDIFYAEKHMGSSRSLSTSPACVLYSPRHAAHRQPVLPHQTKTTVNQLDLLEKKAEEKKAVLLSVFAVFGKEG